MVSIGAAKMSTVVMTVAIVAIAGTNVAFAQQPSCGEHAYGYIGCTPLGTAQLYGAILVAGILAVAVSFGVAGRQYHTIP